MSTKNVMAEPSTTHPNPAQGGDWINLRDDTGWIQARYHPGEGILIITLRGKRTIHNLRRSAEYWLRNRPPTATPLGPREGRDPSGGDACGP